MRVRLLHLQCSCYKLTQLPLFYRTISKNVYKAFMNLLGLPMVLYKFMGAFLMADQVSFIFENMFFNIYFHRDGFNICGRTQNCTEALEDEISSLILDDSSSDDDSKLVELVNIILCSIFGVYMCLEITLMFLPDSFCKPISTFNFMMGHA